MDNVDKELLYLSYFAEPEPEPEEEKISYDIEVRIIYCFAYLC